MTLIPWIINGTATDVNGTALASKTVWFTNESTNQTLSVTTNSIGRYVFDCANFNDYSNGDIITRAIEAYADPGFHLTREPFDDSSVENIEEGDQKLNTATLSVNMKLK